MPTPNPKEPRMEDTLRQEDEITLAGIARQEMALYGEADGESKLKHVFARIRESLKRLFGSQPQK
jgi:hypothetical protein